MSIGNLKTQGGKGTNYPYQLGVLTLLKQISSALGAVPGVVLPKALNVVVDGTTPVNAKSVSLYFSGTGGTFDGAAIPDGATLNYSPGPVADSLAPTAYTVPTSLGGYILITYTL
jgi:hypothetical protein